MNRALRRRHLALVSALAPVTAMTLVAAVAVRRHPPVNPTPSVLTTPAPAADRELSRALVRGEGLTLEVRRLAAADGGMVLELRPLAHPTPADLLVYLAPNAAGDVGSARLLGPLAGPGPVRLPLPAEAGLPGSSLLFYSPALGRLVARDRGSPAP